MSVWTSPGPWVADTYDWGEGEGLQWIVREAIESGDMIAIVFSEAKEKDLDNQMHQLTPRAAADAHLIAMAPEMVMLLRKIVRGMEHWEIFEKSMEMLKRIEEDGV